MTQAKDIHEFLISQGEWINRDNTVDRFTHGDGNIVVTKVAVTWMATTRAIHEAIETGCEMILVHEPLLWNHRDDINKVHDPKYAKLKQELLDKHNITILRCHDLWDRYPEIGIGPSWAKTLEVDSYRIEHYSNPNGRPIDFVLCEFDEGMTLGRIATNYAKQTQHLGQQAISAIGNPEMKIKCFALNIGAWGSHHKFMTEARDRFGIEGAAATEFCWWQDASWALDTGFGLLHVNHGVSETVGMIALYEYLKENFKDVSFSFIKEAAPYQVFTADGALGSDLSMHRWESLNMLKNTVGAKNISP